MTTATLTPEAEQLGLFDAPFVQPTLPAGASLVERWRAFHELNPQVYAAFERQALRLVAAGETLISAKGIFEDLRRGRIQTRGDKFRLNNSFHALYVRLAVARNAVLRGRFDVRRSVGDALVLDEVAA